MTGSGRPSPRGPPRPRAARGHLRLRRAVAQAARTRVFDRSRDVVFEREFLSIVMNRMNATEKTFKQVVSDDRRHRLFASPAPSVTTCEVARP